MAFDPPSRAAGQCSPLPELVQFLKDKNLDGQLDKLLEMSETDLPQKASEFGCGDEDVEQLGKLLRQERDRRAKEPSVGGRLAQALKNSGAQFEARGNKVHVPKKVLHGTPPLLSGEHQWVMRLYAAEFPPEFVEQKPDKDKIILLLGDRTSKQDLINLMLNYNVGMKLQEPRLEINVDQGTEVHSAIAAFKIPAILGGRVESGLTIINAPDFDNDGMEDRIAGQVEQFLTEHHYTISGVCCLVRGSKGMPENYKRAFKAVLKELGQDIAARTMLGIMSGESSDADEEKLKDVWQSIRDAGILYRNWFHFKWPLLLRGAAATHARQDNSDYLAQFFRSLSGKSQQMAWQKDARDPNEAARKTVLDLLEKNPHAAPGDQKAEKEVLTQLGDVSDATKRIVVIGGTGAGKSAFCGLLDGSLKRDPNGEDETAWSSNYKLGHSGNSETDVPELRVADWLGTDAEFPIVIVDTPGMGDSRGEEKDEKHLRTIAGWVNGLRHIDLVVILVGNETRMSSSLRKILLEFQKRFGKDLWAHAMVVVNRWDFYGDKSPERFAAKFREVLQGPTESGLPGQPSNTHLGLGLTEEDCSKMLPFAFLNVQYRNRQTEVVEAMKIELDKMKAKLKELEPWHVRVKAQSEPLNALIDAVRKSNDSATLKQVFHSVNSRVDKPPDLTREKLDAVEEEIVRREKLEEAIKSLMEAEQALRHFEELGTQTHAVTFVKKLDTAIKALPDGMTNPRVCSLKPSWDMLKAALEGERKLCKDLPMDLRHKVDELIAEAKRTKIIESLLTAWHINLISGQLLNQLSAWGVGSEAELARYISEDGLNNFRPSDRPRAKILVKWTGLKNSPTDNLTWKDASAKVKELKELLANSEAAQVPSQNIQKMKEKLEKAKEEEKRPRNFALLRLNMDWRPFGHLADSSTVLRIKEAPETFVPTNQIRIRFNNREVHVKGVERRKELQDGVMYALFDISCGERIPAGDVDGSLVTSEAEMEEYSFSGKMIIPGKLDFKMPFDARHWYCIKMKNGDGLLHVDGQRHECHIEIVRWDEEDLDASQFRFDDTGDGKQEFRIYARHTGKCITNHIDHDDHVKQLRHVSDHREDWQIWTFEEAGNGDFFIRSKKNGKVIFEPRGDDRRKFIHVQQKTGDSYQKFRFVEQATI